MILPDSQDLHRHFSILELHFCIGWPIIQQFCLDPGWCYVWFTKNHRIGSWILNKEMLVCCHIPIFTSMFEEALNNSSVSFIASLHNLWRPISQLLVVLTWHCYSSTGCIFPWSVLLLGIQTSSVPKLSTLIIAEIHLAKCQTYIQIDLSWSCFIFEWAVMSHVLLHTLVYYCSFFLGFFK